MLTAERAAAAAAINSGIYCVYRCNQGQNLKNASDFCFRVAPTSLCFCGSTYACHLTKSYSNPNKKCSKFQWIPDRPEQIGDDFLPRRRGFNINSW